MAFIMKTDTPNSPQLFKGCNLISEETKGLALKLYLFSKGTFFFFFYFDCMFIWGEQWVCSGGLKT